MNSKIIVIAVVVVVVAVGVTSAAMMGLNNKDPSEIEVYQSDGTTKSVPYNPQKVVCLSTYTCEVMMFLGVTDRVVGTCTTTFNNIDLKEAYKGSTDVGAFNGPNIQEILKLEPDLVISYPGYPTVDEAMDDVGLKYVHIKCADAETIVKEVEGLGKLFKKETEAKKYTDYANGIFEKIDGLVKNITTKKTVYMTSFATFNKASSSTSAYYKLAQRAGANMIYEPGASAITIQAADLLSKDPQIIIETPMLSGMVDGKAATTYNAVMNDTTFSELQALQNKNLYLICSQLFGGPRCFAGLVACYNIMYSDVSPSGLTWDGTLKDYNKLMGLSTSIDSLYYPTATA